MAEVAQPKLSPAKLSHVGLRTNNLEPMAKWYQQMLAAKITHQDANCCFLKSDADFLRVALFKIPDTSSKVAQSNGLEHFAFSYDTLADLCNMYKERKELGLIPYRAVHHGPTLSFYYFDPDGNKMEMQWEIITTVEEFEAYRASGETAKNPVGSEMEPDEILRLFESGQQEKLLKREDVGERRFDHIK